MAKYPDNNDQPIQELKDLSVELNPNLKGRVRRDINRRTLAANSLEFSVNVMISTFWEHVYAIMDSVPGVNKNKEDNPHGK